MNAVDRQLKKIAQVFGKEEPPEVKEKTLKIFLKHLRQNVELPCMLTGSEDFEWEEFYIIGPGSKKEHDRLRKTQASYLDTFELIDFVLDPMKMKASMPRSGGYLIRRYLSCLWTI